MIREPLWKLIGILRYKANTLKLLGFIKHEYLMEWNTRSGVVKLPLIIDRGEELYRIVEIRGVGDAEPRIYVFGDIDAILYIDDEIYYGIDRYSDYISLKGLNGRHRVLLRIAPTRVLGERYSRPRLDAVVLAYVDPVIEWYSNKILWLIDLVEGLMGGEGEDLARRLLELMEDSSSRIHIPPPTPDQILLSNNLHYRDYPSRYPMLYDELYLLAYREPGRLVDAGFGSIDYDVLKREIELASRVLDDGLNELGKHYPKRGVVLALANSHLDYAWLWDPGETVFKLLRNTAKITRLLREYDGPVYVFSSALYLSLIEEKEPSLYSELMDLVERGRVLLATATWVESDTMITPHEVLLRQFLYGQKYTLEKTGRYSWIYWLPDSFGYSANLPQILREAGVKIFIGYKTAWNQYNRIPYHTFMWRGIDGTIIPAHLLIGTYTHSADPSSLGRQYVENTEKGVIDETIYAYGYGDGGGGPTHDMIERLEFYSKTPLLPWVKHGGIEEFLEKINRLRDRLPVWYGELYVEAHRGTYTTNTGIKHRVWLLDYLLRVLEQLYALKGIGDRDRLGKLDKYWKKLLILAFHDILPGSSTHRVYSHVYRETDELMKEVVGGIEELLGSGKIYNPTQWRRREVIEIPGGKGISGQRSWSDGRLVLVEIEPYTARRLDEAVIEEYKPVVIRRVDDRFIMENEYLKIVVDERGRIISIRDGGGYEYIDKPSNILTIHDDTPYEWDAWDIDEYSLRHYEEIEPLKIMVVEDGPLRSTILLEYRYRGSTIRQYISLATGSRSIDFKIVADIHDRHIMAKNWFIPRLNTVKAYFETPYGVVERVVSSNTSWEWARYEQPFLNWFTLEDDQHGLAFISPVKHGVSLNYNRVGLTLFRTPIIPDPLSDSGRVEFTYSILPYRGSWLEANVHGIAYMKTNPIYISGSMDKDELGGVEPLIEEVYPDNIVVTAIKPSGGRSVVLRLFNYANKHGKLRLKFRRPITHAYRLNILEEIVKPLDVGGRGVVEYMYKPYEIITLKILYT